MQEIERTTARARPPLRRALAAVPVTCALTMAYLALGVAHALGWAGLPGSVLTPHSFPSEWWAALSSALWARTVPGFLLGAVLLPIAGSIAERRLGHWRFAAAAATSHLAGVLAASGLAYLLRGAGGSWSAQLLGHAYAGPDAMVLGALMASTAGMGTLWRRRIRLAVLSLLALLLLYSGSLADLARLLAAATGLVLGPVLVGHPARRWPPAVSRREARTLVAVAVAVAAVGPVVAGLLPHAVGPLAVLHLVFTGLQPVDPQAVQALCADPSQARDCAAALLQQRAGAGAVFMAVLPSLLLLVLAEGLRRGRRAAWAGALAIECAQTAVAALYIVPALAPGVPADGFGAVDVGTFRNRLALVIPLLTPLVLAVLLLATRSCLSARAPRHTYARLLVRLAITASALALLYYGGALALARGFSAPPGPLQVLADLPDRFLPLGYLTDTPPAFVPETVAATVLYEGVGITFWGVAAALLLGSFLRPADSAGEGDRERAVQVLATLGGTSNLSWMTTWEDNRYWFTPGGTGYIAYRPLAGTALALGGPIVAPGTEQQAVAGFAAFAAANGWTPCLYAAPEPSRAAAEALGWGSVQVAEDAVLDLPALSFTGKRHQNTRTALNRARKEGVAARWTTWAQAPLPVREQVHAISEEWIADKGMPEMGFTLGGIEEMKDPAVRLLLAVDGQGTVHAVSSWLPVHTGGTISGWTLDFMRRRGDGFRPAMEFLIASAALDLKAAGYATLSLSGAPLARTVPPGTGGTVLDRALGGVGDLLEPVYGFRTLHAFKARFCPRWEPLHLAYPDPAALPAIAAALTQAYLPHATTAQRLGLAGRIARGLLRRIPRPTGRGSRQPPGSEQPHDSRQSHGSAREPGLVSPSAGE